MKNLLKQTNQELWKTLEWDRYYGPLIQSRNKRGLPLDSRILTQARSEIRSLEGHRNAINRNTQEGRA